MKQLRPLESSDHDALLLVYRRAVESCNPALYSLPQRQAWAQQARRGSPAATDTSAALRRTLSRGSGLVSCDATGSIAAFGLRDPADRLALLYCHPEQQRRGHATALLRALEAQARLEGVRRLRTEASFLSRPLFEREGWCCSWQEELLIHGVHFRRFRLHKLLAPILA